MMFSLLLFPRSELIDSQSSFSVFFPLSVINVLGTLHEITYKLYNITTSN